MLLFPLACSAPPESVDDTAVPEVPWTAPDQPGPYGVSATTLRWTDARGQDLVAEVWYPVDACDEPEPYEEIRLTGEACRDLAPSTLGAPFPLIAFSHGFAGIRYQSIFLTEALARHGFVVVGVDHPHNTFLDLDPDATADVALRRPGDVRSAVDEVFALSDGGDERLGGLVQPDRYGMSGHSFGGWTTLAVAGGVTDLDWMLEFCAQDDHYDLCQIAGGLPPGTTIADAPDERAVVALSMAPAGWYSFGEQGLDTMAPLLLMGGELDSSETMEEEIQPLYDRLPAPKALAVVAGAGHYAFSDICRIGDLADDCAEEEGGYVNLDLAHARISTLGVAWFGVRLAGDDRYTPYLAEQDIVSWDTAE